MAQRRMTSDEGVKAVMARIEADEKRRRRKRTSRMTKNIALAAVLGALAVEGYRDVQSYRSVPQKDVNRLANLVSDLTSNERELVNSASEINKKVNKAIIEKIGRRPHNTINRSDLSALRSSDEKARTQADKIETEWKAWAARYKAEAKKFEGERKRLKEIERKLIRKVRPRLSAARFDHFRKASVRRDVKSRNIERLRGAGIGIVLFGAGYSAKRLRSSRQRRGKR